MPLAFHEQGVDDFILREHFGIDAPAPDLAAWEGDHPPRRRGARRDADRARRQVRPARGRLPVGGRGAAPRRHPPRLPRERSTGSTRRSVGEAEVDERLRTADGILIPGGFGGRGFEGKIAAARIAREDRIPYLGVCLGMHVAVSEFARHVAGDAGRQLDRDGSRDAVPGDRPAARAEGDRRHGRHDAARRRPGQAPRRDASRARLYGEAVVYERHRHRYEVNNHLREAARGGRARVLGHDAGRAPGRDHRAAARRCTRSTSPRSSTRSSSPARPARAAVPRVRRRGTRALAGVARRERRARSARRRRRLAAMDARRARHAEPRRSSSVTQ